MAYATQPASMLRYIFYSTFTQRFLTFKNEYLERLQVFKET
jgi:hypothetical protein